MMILKGSDRLQPPYSPQATFHSTNPKVALIPVITAIPELTI
ncbi:hypothetical protein [Microseira sp. BLCC-F43]